MGSLTRLISLPLRPALRPRGLRAARALRPPPLVPHVFARRAPALDRPPEERPPLRSTLPSAPARRAVESTPPALRVVPAPVDRGSRRELERAAPTPAAPVAPQPQPSRPRIPAARRAIETAAPAATPPAI